MNITVQKQSRVAQANCRKSREAQYDMMTEATQKQCNVVAVQGTASQTKEMSISGYSPVLSKNRDQFQNGVCFYVSTRIDESIWRSYSHTTCHATLFGCVEDYTLPIHNVYDRHIKYTDVYQYTFSVSSSDFLPKSAPETFISLSRIRFCIIEVGQGLRRMSITNVARSPSWRSKVQTPVSRRRRSGQAEAKLVSMTLTHI